MVYSARQRQFGCNKRDSCPSIAGSARITSPATATVPKDRFIKTPDGQPGLNYLCSGIKRFLTHADPHFRQIVATLHGSGVTQAIA